MKVARYTCKIKELETLLDNSRKETRQQHETITELNTSLVALTEENIHLRAKLTQFSDTCELSLGLDQARDLISNLSRKPWKSLFESNASEWLGDLKEEIVKEHSEVSATLEIKASTELDNVLSTQEDVCKPITEPPKRYTYRRKTKPRTAYIPSHLRVLK